MNTLIVCTVTMSSAKAWTGIEFRLPSLYRLLFAVAVFIIGLHILSMININMSALSGSPVFVPLMMKNNLVKSAPDITLNVECFYRSSIKYAYFSDIPKWDNVSKINSCLTLPNASAKSIKTTINFVLLCRKSSISAFNVNMSSCLSRFRRKALCQNGITFEIYGIILLQRTFDRIL